MIHILIKYHKYRTYTESPSCIVVGKGFCQGKLYEDSEFHALVSSWSTKEDFIKGIQELNGFYMLISRQGGQLFAAVDRVRSIPLFYAQKAQEFYLSDCADWVREQVGNTELDPLAKEEFLLTGYVTGPDTLFPDVKQIQAGECIFVEDTPGGITVEKHRYYEYIHNYPDSVTEEDLLTQHDEVLINIFNRLIKIAAGRTIVVPLSGGLDSRLIVLMLKRLGYDKVIAFSYGCPGNSESVVSKQVADSLGIQWKFVEYSNDLWYQWYHSDEYKRYASFADGCTSLPHIQDWPAVWKLKTENRIPYESIFVPGHSADLPAGSRSASVPELYNNQPIDPRRVDTTILKYHYSLFDWTKRREELKPLFINKIKQTLGNNEQFPDNASAFESWDIAERQAKFIINSLRVYEFWGYDWWMPFWDYEYMQFWCGVPLEFRINQAMYKQSVDKYDTFKNLNIISNQRKLTDGAKKYIKILIKRHGYIKKIALKIYFAYRKRVDYSQNSQGRFGAVDKNFYKQFYTGKENINSLLALQMINILEGASSDGHG